MIVRSAVQSSTQTLLTMLFCSDTSKITNLLINKPYLALTAGIQLENSGFEEPHLLSRHGSYILDFNLKKQNKNTIPFKYIYKLHAAISLILEKYFTGRARLIQSHLLPKISFKITGNMN